MAKRSAAAAAAAADEGAAAEVDTTNGHAQPPGEKRAKPEWQEGAIRFIRLINFVCVVA